MSAEADDDELDTWKHNVIPKTISDFERIESAIKENILFTRLDDDSRQIIIDAMFEVVVEEGHVIIRQGDEGDNFYIVDSGSFEIDVKVGGEEKIVGNVSRGQSFGELALMYSAPRAATVKALEQSRLWAVDRVTFRKTLMEVQKTQRKKYEEFLATVPVLANLSKWEVATVSDALEPKSFDAGDLIIQEETSGDNFYFISKGDVRVSKRGVELGRLTSPSYFGEIALLTNEPRAASITAISPCRVLMLHRKNFMKLLGPLDDILKRNMESYKKYEDIVMAAEKA